MQALKISLLKTKNGGQQMPETIYLKDVKETYQPKTIQQEIKDLLILELNNYNASLKNLTDYNEDEKFSAVLDSLFPRIIGQYEQKKKVLYSLIAGNHIHFKGNIGSGKTEWTKAILDLVPKRMLVLSKCPINEGPEMFYNLDKACPICKINYSDKKEEEIEVKFVERDESNFMGFSWIQGGPSVDAEQIKGRISFEALAKMTAGEKVDLEELLELGALLKANRGVLRIDELGKIKIEYQAELLNTLNQRQGLVTFSEKNLCFPVNVLVLATSKDIGWTDRIIPDLKDRFTEITTCYPEKWSYEVQVAKTRSIDGIFTPAVFEVAGVGAVRRLRNKLLASESEEGISVRRSIDLIDRAKAVAISKNNLGFQDRIVTLENVEEALYSLELEKHFENKKNTVKDAFNESKKKVRECFRKRIKEAVFSNSDFQFDTFIEELNKIDKENIYKTPRVLKFVNWAVGEEASMTQEETIFMLEQYLRFLR